MCFLLRIIHIPANPRVRVKKDVLFISCVKMNVVKFIAWSNECIALCG